MERAFAAAFQHDGPAPLIVIEAVHAFDLKRPPPLMLIEMRSRPSTRCSRLRMNVDGVPSI